MKILQRFNGLGGSFLIALTVVCTGRVPRELERTSKLMPHLPIKGGHVGNHAMS